MATKYFKITIYKFSSWYRTRKSLQKMCWWELQLFVVIVYSHETETRQNVGKIQVCPDDRSVCETCSLNEWINDVCSPVLSYQSMHQKVFLPPDFVLQCNYTKFYILVINNTSFVSSHTQPKIRVITHVQEHVSLVLRHMLLPAI